MKRKILILDTGREWGGDTNNLIELLKRVDRERYDLSALVYHNYKKGTASDIKTELEALGVEFIHLELRKRLYGKALKGAVRGLLSPLPSLKKKYLKFHDYIARVQPAAGAIASVLTEGGFDLLYMNNHPGSNLEGILASEKTGIPCVQHSRIDVKLTALEADAVNRAVRRVICVSDGVMAGLVEGGVNRDRCMVIPNGIDPALKPARLPGEIRKSLGIGTEDFLIGTVGSLTKRKRVDILLDALALLTGPDKKIRCVVVGEGPEEQSLRAKAWQVNLGGKMESVIFTGFSDDALSYIRAMDLFVLTSEKEGLPIVLLEAMLMSRPVVAARVTGPAELVVDGETGFLVDGERLSAAGIAEKVGELLGSPDLRSEMGEKGRKRVIEEFSIESCVRGVERVFEEVLAETPDFIRNHQ